MSLIFHLWTYNYCCLSGHGSCTDIIRKRKLSPLSPAVYSANTSPPKWICIFVSCDKSALTSRRTQAASIAYMFPRSLPSADTSINRRTLNVCRRQRKLANSLLSVIPPAEFVSKAMEYEVLFNKDAVLVCDGGIDHNVPISPPPNKVCIIICYRPISVIPISSMHSMIYLLPYLYQSKTSSHGVLSKSINISMLHHLLLVLAANVGDMSASCHRLVTLSPWLATTGLSWRQKRCDVVIYPCRRAIIESVPAKKMRMSRPPKFYLFSPLPT